MYKDGAWKLVKHNIKMTRSQYHTIETDWCFDKEKLSLQIIPIVEVRDQNSSLKIVALSKLLRDPFYFFP